MMNLFSKSPKFSGNFLNNPNNSTNYTNATNGVVTQGAAKFLAQAKDIWASFFTGIMDYFKSYKFKELIFTLKTISLILTIILLAIIIYVFIKSMALGKKKKAPKKWAKIEKRFNSGVEANYKLAILEADKFYDTSLKALGKDLEKNLSNVDEIKKARRVKNNIVDDSGFALTREDAEKSLNAYKKGLEELSVI